MYAGLASAMIALVFLYVCATIFIFGGELNSVIAKERANELATRRFLHILEAFKTGLWRVDQDRHVAGRMLVLPHLYVRERDIIPGEHLAHAGIDALLEYETVGLRRLLEVREVRALDALSASRRNARRR